MPDYRPLCPSQRVSSRAAYLQEVSGAGAGSYSPVLKLLLRLCQLPFLIPFQVFTPLTFQEKNLKSYILTIFFILFLF